MMFVFGDIEVRLVVIVLVRLVEFLLVKRLMWCMSRFLCMLSVMLGCY